MVILNYGIVKIMPKVGNIDMYIVRTSMMMTIMIIEG